MTKPDVHGQTEENTNLTQEENVRSDDSQH